MYRQQQLHDAIEKEYSRSEAASKKLHAYCKRLPKGSLVFRDEAIYRYVRENGRQYSIVLSHSDNDLLTQLRHRRILKETLPALDAHVSACRQFLQADVLYDPIAAEQALGLAYRGGPMESLLLPGDLQPELWENGKYIKGNFRKEHLVHLSGRGLKVRSKSEAMIATRLEEKDIPFRYEPRLQAGSKIMYPDFEILLAAARRTVYLEHFGLMSDPEYAMASFRKLEEYGKNGFHLGENLFITVESNEEPLTMAAIDNVINEIMKLDTKAPVW